ncbi:MAG: hypothetical protein LUD72_00100 [Bacteroidales bacterium]|nr:hypothetical protein [Bacteroidales bacterium]
MPHFSTDIQELESYYNTTLKLREKVIRDLNLGANKAKHEEKLDKLHTALDYIEEDIMNLIANHI